MDISFLTLNNGWVSSSKCSKLSDSFYIVNKATLELVEIAPQKFCEKTVGAIYKFSNHQDWETYFTSESPVPFKNRMNNDLIDFMVAKDLAKNLSLYNPTIITKVGVDTLLVGDSLLGFNQAIKQHRIPMQVLQANKATCEKFIKDWVSVHKSLVGFDYNQISSLQAVELRTGKFSSIIKKNGRYVLKEESDENGVDSIDVVAENVKMLLPRLDSSSGIICRINGFVSVL